MNFCHYGTPNMLQRKLTNEKKKKKLLRLFYFFYHPSNIISSFSISIVEKKQCYTNSYHGATLTTCTSEIILKIANSTFILILCLNTRITTVENNEFTTYTDSCRSAKEKKGKTNNALFKFPIHLYK